MRDTWEDREPQLVTESFLRVSIKKTIDRHVKNEWSEGSLFVGHVFESQPNWSWTSNTNNENNDEETNQSENRIDPEGIILISVVLLSIFDVQNESKSCNVNVCMKHESASETLFDNEMRIEETE